MKIYTKVTFMWSPEEGRYVEESSEGYEYEGEVAQMKGGGGQTTVQSADPWSKQQPYLEDLFKQAQGVVGQGTPDRAGSTAATQGAVTSLEDYARKSQPLVEGYGAQGQFLQQDVMSPASNPALQEYINLTNKKIGERYTDTVLPAIGSQAVQMGGVGGSREGVAEGIASRGYIDAIQRNTAGMESAGYGQGLNASLKGLALAPQTVGMGAIPAQIQQTIADTKFGLEGLPQQDQLFLLDAYKSLVGGGGYGGDTTTVGPRTGTGGLPGALGGALSGAGLANAASMGTGWGALGAINPAWAVGGMALAGYLS